MPIMLSATLFLNECSTGTPLPFHGSDVPGALYLPAYIYLPIMRIPACYELEICAVVVRIYCKTGEAQGAVRNGC
ncbi:MAG: hypothetical protein HGB23_06875 [Chlorobiaceae bacterium]|nr:hypothetical protein [Chlorobiaceae bacterium]